RPWTWARISTTCATSRITTATMCRPTRSATAICCWGSCCRLASGRSRRSGGITNCPTRGNMRYCRRATWYGSSLTDLCAGPRGPDTGADAVLPRLGRSADGVFIGRRRYAIHDLHGYPTRLDGGGDGRGGLYPVGRRA